MIEKIVLDYLTEKMQPVAVSMEVPENSALPFVVVEKTGSGRTNKIGSATFAIQSYAGSLLLAAELNEAVKSAMDDMAELAEVCSTRLNSDYNFTDTASKRYRYQAVYDITHY
ncbi:MAG: hypothetical protein ACK5L3_14775 [Oscillospiraceae bacterium]